MSIKKIRTALNTHLQLIPNLPSLQLENTKNIAVSGQAFTRATLLPAETFAETIGVSGKNRNHGLYQIDLFGVADNGTDTVDTLADVIISHFKRGTTLTEDGLIVNIEMAWSETGSILHSFYNVPVVIRWRAHTTV